jgi:type VI secretion system secreted protein Hcp
MSASARDRLIQIGRPLPECPRGHGGGRGGKQKETTMAYDVYCQIDGVPGESTSAGHEDWIEILSVEHGISQPPSITRSSVGGGSTERANHRHLVIEKQMDKASPKLFLKCHIGENCGKVTLDFCRAGGTKVVYMKCEMNNVIISQVDTVGFASEAGGFPKEKVAFNYDKITWTYTQQLTDGTAGGQVTSYVDLHTQTWG